MAARYCFLSLSQISHQEPLLVGTVLLRVYREAGAAGRISEVGVREQHWLVMSWWPRHSEGVTHSGSPPTQSGKCIGQLSLLLW